MPGCGRRAACARTVRAGRAAVAHLPAMTDLIRVSHGLWRPPADVVDLPGRCAALLGVLPPGSVFSGVTAASLHGLWLPEGQLGKVEVTITRDALAPREFAGSRRSDLRARRRTLASDDRDFVGGLPVTSAARTWIDLAAELPMPDLVAAGDSVLRRPGSADSLREALNRARGQRGVCAARAAVEFLDPRSISRPESHLRYAVLSSGLPPPLVNMPIYTARGEWLAEPDLCYRAARVALEYNGSDHATVRRMRRDMTRGVDLVAHGWLAIAFGPAEVFGRPWQIGPLVAQVLEDRAPALLREWRERRRVMRHTAPLAG